MAYASKPWKGERFCRGQENGEEFVQRRAVPALRRRSDRRMARLR